MLTTSSTETGSGPYPLLQTVWDCGISDPAVWCSAMWCGVLQSFGGTIDRILLASVIVHTCDVPKIGSGNMSTTAVSLGCPVSLRTSSFQTNWCYLIHSSICRHQWSKVSIFHASVLETAQQYSDLDRTIGRMHVVQLQLRWRWYTWPPNLVV